MDNDIIDEIARELREEPEAQTEEKPAKSGTATVKAVPKAAKTEKNPMPGKTDKKPRAVEKPKAEKPSAAPKAKKSGHKGLVIVLIVLLVLAIALAVVFFVVYNGVHIWLTAELGAGLPDASHYLRGEGSASYESSPDISLTEEGNYTLHLSANDRSYTVLLFVRDTTAPSASDGSVSITIDDKIDAKDAVKDLSDASEVTASWENEPTFGTAGTYVSNVKLEDAYGNKATVSTTVKVLGAAEKVTYEAGDEHPALADFMVVERDDAAFATDLDSLTWNIPGEYKVDIKFGGTTYSSTLEIVDTVAPVTDFVPAAVEKGGSVKAEDFILTSDDATEVSYAMPEEAGTDEIGTVPVKLEATDLGGNTESIETELFVCDKVVEVEAADGEFNISSVAGYSKYTVPDDEIFSLKELGAHKLTLQSGSESLVLGVVVKDTTAPAAEGISYDCCIGYPCAAKNFVTDINDVTAVKVSFVEEPDWQVMGEQDVTVLLTDRAGNTSEVKAKAMLAPDKTAPEIFGAADRRCYVGDAVAYYKELAVVDNADPEPTVTVDKSKVDPKTAGSYEVTYTATDHEGNSSTKTVTFTFAEKTVTDEQLQTAVDKVLGEIWTDGMTAEEQAYAIFCYCYDHITYTGSSNKDDWKAEAYNGLTKGVGDCFTFYAASYLLLQQIDENEMQVLSVERYQGKTQHFWCLVNFGTGWYNFDPCNVGPQHLRCFMMTTNVLMTYSSQYWRLDTSLYPELATEPYQIQSANIHEG